MPNPLCIHILNIYDLIWLGFMAYQPLQLYFKQFSLAQVHSLNVKTVLFLIIQFSISPELSSIRPIDRTLSGTTAPGQNGPGNDGNEEVLCIPQSSSITGASPSDCLVSYQDTHCGSLTPLQRCSWCNLKPPKRNWKRGNNKKWYSESYSVKEKKEKKLVGWLVGWLDFMAY